MRTRFVAGSRQKEAPQPPSWVARLKDAFRIAWFGNKYYLLIPLLMILLILVERLVVAILSLDGQRYIPGLQ